VLDLILFIIEVAVKSHKDTNVCHSRESGNPFQDQVEDKYFRYL